MASTTFNSGQTHQTSDVFLPSSREGTELLSENDLHMLRNWTKCPPPRGTSCVHQLVSKKGSSQPNALAVDAWDGSVTYAEMERLSSAVAYKLASTSHEFIPILLGKTRWAAVAMLGVLKAGKAFVLLDPSYPAQRLYQICESLDARLVIASDRTVEITAMLNMDEVFIIDSIHIGPYSKENSNFTEWADNPNDPAYVAFTSGSTGVPKGAIVTNGAFATSMAGMQEVLGLDSHSRVLQFAAHAFDMSIFDYLLTLCAGGCVCIPSDTECKNDLAMIIRDKQMNWACLTPSVARSLAGESLVGLETLVLVGEAVGRTDVETWAGKVNLKVLYGQTECGIATTVSPSMTLTSNPTCIGYPTLTSCWVVDPDDPSHLVPVGTAGELLVEGPGLSEGYFNNKESTIASFIGCPDWIRAFRQSDQIPGRLYKTGDLVRYNSDGSLDYLGRKDSQVKVRGQRVELSEVESWLRRTWSTEIRDVVAGLANLFEGSGSSGLVAFIAEQSKTHSSASVDEIFLPPSNEFLACSQAAASNLQQLLPIYMVPTLYIPVAHLPMTGSGKTDRRRLLDEVKQLTEDRLNAYRGLSLDAKKLQPESETETMLQSLVADVLHVRPISIGMEDNFFAIGGDSLMAIKLSTQARRKGFRLFVEDIFSNPSAREMSIHICSNAAIVLLENQVPAFSLIEKREESIAMATAQCNVDEKQIEDIYPCTEMQEWQIGLSANGVDNFSAVWEFDLPTDLDVTKFKAAWSQVSQAQSILRTRIIRDSEGKFMQVVLCDSTQVSYVTSDEYSRSEQIMDIWGFGQSLLQVNLVKNLNGSHKCIVAIHHVLWDAYSFPLIFHQVEGAYYGRQPPVRPFQHVAAHVVKSRPKLQELWSSRLPETDKNFFPPLPNEEYKSLQNAHQECILPISMTGRGDNITIPTKLQLCLAIVISQHMKRTDATFCMTGTGRGLPVDGIDEMIGPTLGVMPVRIDWMPNERIGEVLQRVQSQAAQMLPYETCGLRSVTKFTDSKAAVSSFRTLLLVHPAHGAEASMPAMFEQGKALSSDANVVDMPLAVLCNMSNESVAVTVQYDSKILSDKQIRELITALSSTFELVHTQPEELMSQMA
ncbi:hypothetical protein N7490_003659 [Penicillium lividum]|nr:hypothetical protein N7490_003659 [Penicillium lividum]